MPCRPPSGLDGYAGTGPLRLGRGETYPPQFKLPREVSIGIAVELFGIAFGVFRLALEYGYGAGIKVTGNPAVASLGVLAAPYGW